MSTGADEARQVADRAALAAGVTLRPLDAAHSWAAARLLTDLWGSTVIEAPMMTALSHSGAYVAGAFTADDDLVAVCVGYFAQPLGTTVHSHVTGVRPDHARRGIGLALKLDQRAWCLERGLTRLTWTFDPLIARNAAFNIGRLGAGIGAYLVDFYGSMTDAVNAGHGSDRLLAQWDLNVPWPPPPTPRRDPDERRKAAAVALPADIEALRRSDPALAARWRDDVRRQLADRIGHGWNVTGFDDDRYFLEAPA